MNWLKRLINNWLSETVEWELMTLRDGVELPVQAHPGDAGMDLRSAETLTVLPGTVTIVPTGLAGQIPEGYEIQIRPRSGMAAKQMITVINTPGTVDHGYVGEIKVALINFSKVPYTITKGDRIAQAVVAKLPKVSLKEVEALSETKRGAGGFGSSGKA